MHAVPCNFLYLIPLIPFVVSAINGLIGRKLPRVLNGLLACAAVAGSAFFAVQAVLTLHNTTGEHNYLTQKLWTWITTPKLTVNFELMVDPLTSVLLLIVTGVGFLIHLYSVGYMEHEDDPSRFFCQLNLFVGFMLVLVMAQNLLVMFIGWEGVGACSYLLIGFYFLENEKASAGKKAFIVNRVGDVSFVMGVLLLLAALQSVTGTSTLDFTQLRDLVPKLALKRINFNLGTFWHMAGNLELQGISLPGIIALLLLGGATGKSAQIPLYVWLPDAMAGPTPVSALIHAATMVTAGVFMICRMSFLFVLSPHAMGVIAWVGALTALFAAIMGLAQRDIKKVLAYSTISQLGYLFLAVGVGAFSSAIFHLTTHAFFKALLFLGAGAVIHSLHGEQDMFKMGGLASKLPLTYWPFLLATLAIAGIPPFAGFFSKDEILAHVWHSQMGMGHRALFAVGLAAAFLTAFYMFRLFFMVFWGPTHLTHHQVEHIHDSPWTMALPLAVLGVLATFGGALNLPFGHEWLHHKLEPALATFQVEHHVSMGSELMLMGLSVAVALAGIALAYQLYAGEDRDQRLQRMPGGPLYWLVYNKFFIDEIYEVLIVTPLLAFSQFLRYIVDATVIDGWLVLGPARIVAGLGARLKEFQSGDVQRYILLLTIGATAMVVYLTTHYR
jgi:NADH-quinone oxidoreductase subunit L